MESNQIKQQTSNAVEGFTASNSILKHWQGHRKLTRQVIEIFPEDKLFNYSIGGMRPFSGMLKELIGIADSGIQDLFQPIPTPLAEVGHHSGKPFANSKWQPAKATALGNPIRKDQLQCATLTTL